MGEYAWVFDIACLSVIGLITWAVGSEGLFGAAIMFVNVMFAGLLAFSYYEPVARMIGSIGFMETFADFVSLVVLFGVFFTVIRLITDYLGPWYVRFHGAVDQVGRWVFGLATGWYVAGMVVCMVQTAPVHKMFLGYQWQTHSLWTMGIDRYWLGFVQATTEKYFDWDPPRTFDAKSDFMMRYHRWRPFGDPDPTMPGSGTSTATGTPGAEGGQTGGPGGASGGGRPPVDPTGATQQPNF
jgi:Colicin V production protein